MSTTFQLRNIKMSDFEHLKPVKQMEHIAGVKTKFDIINPGQVSYTSAAGGIVRVLQRGEVYNKDGNPYDREAGRFCWHHKHPFDGIAMGIPIRIKGKVVYMDGIFCSYSCTLAYLEEEMKKMPVYRDPNYIHSNNLLRQLFEEEFPGQILVAALDWKVLKDVGNGNLSLKEFLSGLNGIRLVQCPCYHFSPVTVSYDIISQ